MTDEEVEIVAKAIYAKFASRAGLSPLGMDYGPPSWEETFESIREAARADARAAIEALDEVRK